MKLSTSSGPWAVGSNGATVKVVDAEGKAVCMLTPRRDQFNGDLIAAAPDLLAALRIIVENKGNLFPIDWDNANAAINKATGVQP